MLPSPIPHPLEWFDAPGWMREALEWVVGVDWPDGNEKLVWDTADLWFEAASALTGPRDAATAAAREVVDGWGGSDTTVAAAFLAAWHDVGGSDEAALAALSTLSQAIGEMTESCGCDIQAAKIETYVELGLLLMELISLAVAASFTFGAASAGAAPAMMATRMAIQQILKKLAMKLLRKGLKEGAERAAERATKIAGRRGVGLATRTGRHMLEEGAEEIAVDYGTQSYQISTGRRDGYDGTSLLASFAGGAAGGALGGLAGLGPSAKSTVGHVAESLGRGAAGEMLAETGASLVTGQGLPDAGNLARSATSGMTSGAIHHAHHNLDHTLDTSAAALDGVPGPPGLSALAATTVAGTDSGGADPGGPGPGGGTGVVEATVGGVVDGAGHRTGDGVPPAGAPSGSPPSGHSPGSHAVADHGADTPGVTTGGVPSQPMPEPTGVGPGHGDGHISLAALAALAPDQQGGPAPAAPTPPGGLAPQGGGVAQLGGLAQPGGGFALQGPPSPSLLPGEVLAGSAVANQPAGTRPSGPAWSTGPEGSTTRAGMAPAPASTHTPAAYSPDATRPVPGANRPVHPVAPSHFGGTPPVSGAPAVSGAQMAPGREEPLREGPRETTAAEAAEGRHRIRETWGGYEHDRNRTAAEQTEQRIGELAEERSRTRDEYQQAWDNGQHELAHRLEQRVAQLDQAIGELRDEPAVPAVVYVNLDVHAQLNREVLPTAAGGVVTGERSALTGAGHPPSVTTTRAYGEWGGHRQPLEYDQVALERAMPRDENGRVLRVADLNQPWFQLVNDGGPRADPTRALNCTDAVLSLFDTVVHGRPRVAAARTFDAYARADTADPIGGELGGLARAQRVLGAEFTTVYTVDTATYASPEEVNAERMAEISGVLLAEGHGSFAMFVNTWGDGGAHAWAAVNHHGTIQFADPQNGLVHHEPLYRTEGYRGGMDRLDVIVLDAAARPVRVTPGELHQRYRPWEASEPTGSGHPSRDGHAESTDRATPRLAASYPIAAPSGRMVDAVLQQATTCRTPEGLVDRAAAADLLDGLPTIDPTTHGVAEALTLFTAEALGRESVELQAVSSGGAKGQSGAPVFLARDDSGAVVAVAKIFPRPEELVSELSSLERLCSPQFTRFAVPAPHAAALLPDEAGPAGVLVFAVAPGRSIDDLIEAVHASDSSSRESALEVLNRAVVDVAIALAELHTVPAGSGGRVSTSYLDFHVDLARRLAETVIADPEVYQTMGLLDLRKFRGLLDESIANARSDSSAAALVHGDAHPGNFFWDPSKGVTFIDTPTCHYSMDAKGAPIAAPERDISNFDQRLAHYCRQFDLTESETTGLRHAFLDAYNSAGGAELSESKLKMFGARSVLNKLVQIGERVKNTQHTSLEDNSLGFDVDLRAEIDLLKRALGWED